MTKQIEAGTKERHVETLAAVLRDDRDLGSALRTVGADMIRHSADIQRVKEGLRDRPELGEAVEGLTDSIMYVGRKLTELGLTPEQIVGVIAFHPEILLAAPRAAAEGQAQLSPELQQRVDAQREETAKQLEQDGADVRRRFEADKIQDGLKRRRTTTETVIKILKYFDDGYSDDEIAAMEDISLSRNTVYNFRKRRAEIASQVPELRPEAEAATQAAQIDEATRRMLESPSLLTSVDQLQRPSEKARKTPAQVAHDEVFSDVVMKRPRFGQLLGKLDNVETERTRSGGHTLRVMFHEGGRNTRTVTLPTAGPEINRNYRMKFLRELGYIQPGEGTSGK